MSKVMLIDGHSLAYRAFFALPTDIATASGQVTNAVYGFTSMLLNLWRDHDPDRIVVVFDRPEPTFRHEIFGEYKAQRDSAPDILRQQMGLLREMVDALGLPTAEAAGFEADDVIATLATQARDAADDVIVVTGDRDSYQLVEDPHVKVLYNRRGVSDYVLYDEAGILERTGVRPVDYVSFAALRGDTSDNLPGVPGVGEKTAARLVNEKGGVPEILEALDDYTPRLRENLAASAEQVKVNAEVMTLVRDVPLEHGLGDLAMQAPDTEQVRKLFDFLEFRSLHPRLAEIPRGVFDDVGAPADSAVLPEPKVTVCDTGDEAAAALRTLAEQPADTPLAAATPHEGLDAGLALVADQADASVVFIGGTVLSQPPVMEALGELVRRPPDGEGVRDAARAGERTDIAGPARRLVLHGAKPVIRGLLDRGIDMADPLLDTRLAAYLLDPADTRYELEVLLMRYAGIAVDSQPAPQGQLDLTAEEATDTPTETARAALAVSHLAGPLREALQDQGLAHLNDDVEVPLVRVLARMEQIGIGVDPAVLTRIRDELRVAAAEMRSQVIADAGHDFNVNSPQQLGRVLFEELGLTPLKRTKTGYSTDARSLERLRDEHPIVSNLMEYRELEKLRSTYGEGLLAEVGPGDRIRATFNQTVARTGRLSSDAPNLHNIPVRSERGRVFRTAFVARDGFRLLVADYNQIELRCIAHLAGDPGLIAAFEAGDDIHTATAAQVFGIDPDEVGTAERSKAKMVSYGLAYGMEAYGLGQRLNIATSEAAEILDAYFAAFPAVREYMRNTVDEARSRGYTETLFGRRRQIPELASRNARIRQAGERQAMNAGIQGLAADIFKVALVRLDRGIEATGLVSRIVLQVHDEIIVEAPDAEVDEAMALTRDVMSGAFELRVPLEVNLSVGRTWADSKG